MSTAGSRAQEKSPEAFRTISEVSEELDLPQHVLRFWETRFAQVKPMKRSGGRRLYRPDHVALLRGIKALLYDDGLTIKGVQKMLRESGARTVIARGKADAALSLEMNDHGADADADADADDGAQDEGMLPLDLPEDAAERLAALKDRVAARKVPAARTARGKVDAERVRRSIDRLEALLAELENDTTDGARDRV